MSDANGSGKKGLFGSIGSALKSAVFEEVPDAPPSAQVAPQRAAAPPPVVVKRPVVTVAPAAAAAIDPEVRKLLDRDVQLAAHPAYTEFIKISDSLAAILPDEELRIKAALAAIKANGMTTENILVDIEECFAALDKKTADVAKAAAKERTDRVGGRENELKRINETLDKLTAQIAELEAQKDKLADEIVAETDQIEQAELRFEATVDAYRAELTDKKNKILNSSQGK